MNDSVKKDMELWGLKEEDVNDQNNWRRLVDSRPAPRGNTATQEESLLVSSHI